MTRETRKGLWTVSQALVQSWLAIASLRRDTARPFAVRKNNHLQNSKGLVDDLDGTRTYFPKQEESTRDQWISGFGTMP